MLHTRTITFTLIILTFITKHGCKKLPYGSPCKWSKDCRDGSWDDFANIGGGRSFNPYTMDGDSICNESRCKCKDFIQSREWKNNNYVCIHFHFGKGLPRCNSDNPATCANGTCKHEYISNDRCICNDGFVYVGYHCRETVNVDYAEDCKTPVSGSVPVCPYDRMMQCNSNGKCECYINTLYDSESHSCLTKESYIEKYPELTKVGLSEFCGISPEGLPKVCDETTNMKCVNSKCKCTKNTFYDSESHSCLTKESYIEKYPELTKAGLSEFCGISPDGLPKFCDETTNMACVNSKCKCTINFYPLEANKTCESKDSYVKEHNLTSYKVIPGVYCHNDYDCITGLDCYSNLCACPNPCTFDKKKSACDCGEVSGLEGAGPAILVGVIGGLVIVIFWAHLIKKKMRTPKKNPNSREYEPVHIEPPTSVPLTDHNRDQPTANSAPSAAPLHPESASRDPLPIPDDNQNPQVSSFTSVINSQHKGSTFTFSSTSRPTSRAPSPGRNPDPFSDIPYPLSPNADTEPEYSRGPAQNPGVVPSAYAPSAPPSSTSQTGPSDPPPYSDPPPAYEDIYKPVIS